MQAMSLHSVREVAAVRMPDTEMGERVCVFVVRPDGAPGPDLEALYSFMLERGLAKFKIPERLEFIDALPMNPAGTKVNKKALERIVAAAPGTETDIEGGFMRRALRRSV